MSWDAGPAGATAVIEANPRGYVGFAPIGGVDATQSFIYTAGGPNNYGYRVKFVQGDRESGYSEAVLRINTGGFTGRPTFRVWLPLTRR